MIRQLCRCWDTLFVIFEETGGRSWQRVGNDAVVRDSLQGRVTVDGRQVLILSRNMATCYWIVPCMLEDEQHRTGKKVGRGDTLNFELIRVDIGMRQSSAQR